MKPSLFALEDRDVEVCVSSVEAHNYKVWQITAPEKAKAFLADVEKVARWKVANGLA